MEKKYVIMSRYEHWTSDGKVFTDWFYHDSKERTLDEANEYIKQVKRDFDFIDKKTHLKHEYKVVEYSEYETYIENIRAHSEELAKQNEAYYKSDEYKELQKKKRQAAKERKERQKKYLEEHENNE